MNTLSRIFKTKSAQASDTKSVIYWMSREQRVSNNFGLTYAQMLAEKNNQKLFVVFTLAGGFLGAGFRQFDFMLTGLQSVEIELKKLNIPFVLLHGEPADVLSSFASKMEAGTIVYDFDPLRIKQTWQRDLAERVKADLFEVDGHNIVPCKIASQKPEFGAYTLRPKIKRLLDNFLPQEASVHFHTQNTQDDFVDNDFDTALQNLQCDKSVTRVDWIQSGESAAKEALKAFIETRLDGYASKRNDPNKHACSNLSIYLHFGQIYAGECAKAISNANGATADKEAFLEELIVRKELSDNYCFYNPNYDNFDGFPNWAKLSLAEHEDDIREWTYSVYELESATTHDELWNAAQSELLKSGKIHGYMRMYWAKKILEYTPTVQIAQDVAIYLNDKYALDGRDPNGYVGIAWSIGGVHDRAWFDRKIFGKVRYMNANGAKSKFDVKAYCARWL